MLFNIKALALFSLFTYTAAKATCATDQVAIDKPEQCAKALDKFFASGSSDKVYVQKDNSFACGRCEVKFVSNFKPEPPGFDVSQSAAQSAYDSFTSQCPYKYGSILIGEGNYDVYLYLNPVDQPLC